MVIKYAQYLKSQQSHSKKGMVVAIVVSSVAALFFVICVLSWLVMRKRKGKRRQNNLLFSPNSSTSFRTTQMENQFDESGTNAELPLFNLMNIVAATDNFSSLNKLGQGGFGTVYKVGGWLGGEKGKSGGNN
ncbi:G-type lectin S-receptor-like serine/threonine-protein kinase RKS1 [Camellia lanceoleosa]|uniref:G-type lectin S-receptor-like serine/threonine-protein kinase RKS1 n=1 Tax=Camellia lanceoleosa TaxID=1840588 RepID=A0ACC0GMU1_9ERIC|nr:G-type lectin S-receptor-like serine/threonine-protein kinase RKS1 [Camellia lanceoleosa]